MSPSPDELPFSHIAVESKHASIAGIGNNSQATQRSAECIAATASNGRRGRSAFGGIETDTRGTAGWAN